MENYIYKIYLDQNILDFILKDKFPEISISNNDNIDIKIEYIYSSTTLDEFNRIDNEKYRSDFLNLLKEKKAKYIEVDHNTENYKLIGCDPIEKYKSHIENRTDSKSFSDDSTDFIFKLLTGNETRSYSDILTSYFGEIKEFTQSSLNNSREFLDDSTAKVIEESMKIIEKGLDQMPNIIRGILPSDDDKSNNLKNLKNVLPYKIDELNNIPPEEAVDYIWEKFKTLIPNETNNIRIEEFFEKISSTNSKKKWGMLERINFLYNFLNYYGYWQDKKLDKKRKFIPSLNDAGHAFYASYADLFITRDIAFYMKLKAVYHYYKINTSLHHHKEIEKNE